MAGDVRGVDVLVETHLVHGRGLRRHGECKAAAWLPRCDEFVCSAGREDSDALSAQFVAQQLTSHRIGKTDEPCRAGRQGDRR